jgi:hypothetical protein
MLEVGHGTGLFEMASALVLAFSITIDVSRYSGLLVQPKGLTDS